MSSSLHFSSLEKVAGELTPNVEIPQSWVRIVGDKTQIHSISMPISGYEWQPFAEIPYDVLFGDLAAAQKSPRLVYRGCAPQTADYLATLGYLRLCSGMEAVLELAEYSWDRASIRALARRGRRFGRPEEFHGEMRDAALKTTALFEHSRYAERPKLRYLFRLAPESSTRCFYFRNNSGDWLGALTLSVKNKRFIATELLLRSAGAPVGIMESLISFTAQKLKNEGIEFWSLGEVPFYREGAESHRLEAPYIMIGRLIRFAYNYKGLYAFKNKFRPHWRPVYLCAKPNITLALLADMAISSGFSRLVGKVAADIPKRRIGKLLRLLRPDETRI